ncbi:tobamovirus multiplication protein 1-like isoform x1 [Anaeramoeba flamelloides]|uniref:Tobamovirus multiplication protein 1-like isoform x1 n=1 Tax=Anaeramoeba flamelloides TaxID=1746091 RepID=A0ABQ8Z670_9EUKA|nr:tobamovirus multiplication protein 1-like isoform x1 [Anaeramoeba flamelloides]
MKWDLLFGIIILGLIFLWTIYQLLKSIKYRKEKSFTSIQFLFHVLTLFYCIARIFWLSLQQRKNNWVVFQFSINRFAILSFFTSFTLLVFFWAQIYHNLLSKMSSLKTVHVVLNSLLYIYTIICIILFGTGVEKDTDNNPFYDVNVLIIAGVSVCTSLAFFVYGFLLMRKYGESVFHSNKKRHLLKIFSITILYSACFLLRFIMFLYRPITGKYFPYTYYIFFFYYVPEIPPIVVQLWTMKIKTGLKKNNKQINAKLIEEESFTSSSST